MPLLLALVAAVPFAPILQGEFLDWDDLYNFVNNPHMRSLTVENLRWMFSTFHTGNYQPLTWVVYGLQHRLWGWRAEGFHAFGLALHVLNTLLVFSLARMLLSPRSSARTEVPGAASGPQPVSDATWAAAITSLLFALHPLRTECVGWISSQPHLNGATLCLLTLYSYIRSARSAGSGPSPAFPVAALLWYAVSLLSMPVAIGLPVVLLALDVFPLGRWRPGWRRRLLLEKVPFLLLASGAAVMANVARTTHDVVVPLEAFGIWPRLAQASFCAVFHVYKTLVPTNLTPIYVMLDGFDPWGWRFVGSTALVVAVTLACAALRRRLPILGVVWVSYLAMLLPFMGLTDTPHYPVDRYTYLSTLGFALLAGAGVQACRRAASRGQARGRLFVPVVSLGLACAAALAVLSWRQSGLWRNTIVLMEHVLHQMRDYPGRSGFVAIYANALAAEGRNEEALAQYSEAVEVDPENWDAHWQLGVVADRLGRWGESVQAYQTADRLHPDHVEINLSLGAALASVGRVEPAMQRFERAVRISPQDYRGYYNWASVLSGVGRFGEALDVLQEGRRQTGGHVALDTRVAWLLAACPDAGLRDGDRALQLAEKLNRRAGGDDPQTLDLLAVALAEVGRFDRAERVARQALQACEARNLGDLCAGVRNRVKLFAADRPYRMPSRGP